MFEKSKFSGDISKWKVGKVTDMNSMFKLATKFNSELLQWDVSKVTDMSYMFFGAAEFNRDISKWNTSKVKDMQYMFSRAKKFNSNTFTISKKHNVNKMQGMFDQQLSLIKIYQNGK